MRGCPSLQLCIRLAGTERLAKVKELGDTSKPNLVRGCGYVRAKKDSGERQSFTVYYETTLEAKGMSFGAGSGDGQVWPARQLSYATTLQFNSNLLVVVRPTPPSWACSPGVRVFASGLAASRWRGQRLPAAVLTELFLSCTLMSRRLLQGGRWPSSLPEQVCC